MVHSPRRLTVSALAIGLLATGTTLPACSKSTPAGGTATVPTAPPTTADQWAVPATITPDYLNRVLAKLNQIDGDAVRDARRANAITPTFDQLEHAIRGSGHEFELYRGLWKSSVADGWRGIAPIPGDRKTTVVGLLRSDSHCVVASVNQDLSSQAAGSVRTFKSWYVALVPGEPSNLNPTRWTFVYDGHEPDDSQPTSPCAVSA